MQKSDGYFAKSSAEYDEHLATLSMHLAAAGGQRADTVKDILAGSGFLMRRFSPLNHMGAELLQNNLQ